MQCGQQARKSRQPVGGCHLCRHPSGQGEKRERRRAGAPHQGRSRSHHQRRRRFPRLLRRLCRRRHGDRDLHIRQVRASGGGEPARHRLDREGSRPAARRACQRRRGAGDRAYAGVSPSSLRGANRRSNRGCHRGTVWIASLHLQWRDSGRCAPPPHNSRAFENTKLDTRRVVSSRISVRVIGGSARWAQFSRSQSRQLTPIGVPSVFSRSMPAA